MLEISLCVLSGSFLHRINDVLEGDGGSLQEFCPSHGHFLSVQSVCYQFGDNRYTLLHLQIRDSLAFSFLFYCITTVFVSVAFLLTTALVTSHFASPSGVETLLFRIIHCIIGDHPYLESVTIGAQYLSNYRNLSYTDAVCGAALNTLLWHNKRTFGCNLDMVKNMRPHEYLEHIYTEHSKCKQFHKKNKCTLDDRTQRELSHYVEYAVVIYGRSM